MQAYEIIVVGLLNGFGRLTTYHEMQAGVINLTEFRHTMVGAINKNCIAVAHGANHALTPMATEQVNEAFKNTDVLVMQAETPYDTIAHAAALAKQSGCKVLLNPAPAWEIDDRLMSLVDIPVVNETEATACSGSQQDSVPKKTNPLQRYAAIYLPHSPTALCVQGRLRTHSGLYQSRILLRVWRTLRPH